MIRSALLLLLTILVACSGPARSFEEILPATPGGWTRSSVSPVGPNSAPEIVRQLGLNTSPATYAGPAAITSDLRDEYTDRRIRAIPEMEAAGRARRLYRALLRRRYGSRP